MAGSFSDYFEAGLLGLVFGNRAFTIPATYYIGLWTIALTDASTGASAGEVSTSGTAYARVSVTNNSTNFSAPTTGPGSLSNAVTFTFPTATATWGTITHIALLDSATVGAGNIICWSDLNPARIVTNGDTPQLVPGDLPFALD